MPKTASQTAREVHVPTVGDAPKHQLLQPKKSEPRVASALRHHRQHHHQQHHGGGRRQFAISTNANEPAAGDEEDADAATTSGVKRTRHAVAAGLASGTVVTERASDDYCLERFKKNMRFNRNSKIKIA